MTHVEIDPHDLDTLLECAEKGIAQREDFLQTQDAKDLYGDQLPYEKLVTADQRATYWRVIAKHMMEEL